jgi:alpha-tubulin suppressor-like RCC1 family protein
MDDNERPEGPSYPYATDRKRVMGDLRSCTWFFTSCCVALAVSACGGGGDDGPGAGGGRPDAYATPVLVSDTLRFVALDTSHWHTCGVAVDGSTWCWGANHYGELGVPDTSIGICDIPGVILVPCTGTPRRVSGAPAFTSLSSSLGANHTCGVSTSGAAWCWGVNAGGQLGDGRRVDSAQPVPVAGNLSFATIRSSLDGGANCGLTLSNEWWCWGPRRELFGDVLSGAATVPVRADWARMFIALDIGQLHACGLAADGQAWCWGNNWFGQLGVGSAGGSGGLARSDAPVRVSGGHTFLSISTGSDHSCGLDDAGAAWCWGVSSAMGSPPPTLDYVGTPLRVASVRPFASIASGQLHACGLTADGEAWCWGQNYSGELGNGTRSPSNVPVRVNATVHFTRLAHRATCGLTSDGQAWCWGGNPFGQVGRTSPYER